MRALCCCCCIKAEERDIVNDNEWVITLFNSSETEVDEETNEDNDQIPFMDIYSDVENSVEDEQYYRDYMVNSHLLLNNEREHRKSLSSTIEYLERARHLMNENFESMTALIYKEIDYAYALSIEYCPVRDKASLVREYEHFREIYKSLVETDERATRFANHYWQEAHSSKHTIERQMMFYRLAIMICNNETLRREWKHEYNHFFRKNHTTA